uniref:Uncharacterized protein n=1 Tax=Solanum tuberosum TaxID=4113 RepID=M1DQN7_SOLTU
MQNPNGDLPKALCGLIFVLILSLNRWKSILSRSAIRTPKGDILTKVHFASTFRVFYTAYAQAFPKKRKGVFWKPLEEVKVKDSFGALETIRVDISTLRAEVVQLQSTDISMIWGEVLFLDTPTHVPEMPSVALFSSEQPEVVVNVETKVEDESEREDEELAEETDEEEL